MSGAAILDDLDARGLIHDTTDRDVLAAALAAGPVDLYHGIDPTADSLHVGNFVGVLALRRFQDAGHRPIALVGGATGMIGDPSGRSDERNLLDRDTLAANVEGIRSQLERFLDFGTGGARLVNNHDWTRDLTMLEFLRDVGKHVTVNQMVAKESVRSRMAGESGISYTEFSYMLLQAFDYWWLAEHEGCTLQIGGSDQWGNITAGIDLIRRRGGPVAHGLTWPLITKADGTKFGKSQQGNVWLSAERTSPYAFYQHWIRTDDRDLRRFLLQLTLLPVGEVDDLLERHEADPGARVAHERLAVELTSFVHGSAAAETAREASQVLFTKRPERPSDDALASLVDEVPTARVAVERFEAGWDLVELLVEIGAATSKGDARRAIGQGAVSVNGERRAEGDAVEAGQLWGGRYALVRRGKEHHLVVC